MGALSEFVAATFAGTRGSAADAIDSIIGLGVCVASAAVLLALAVSILFGMARSSGGQRRSGGGWGTWVGSDGGVSHSGGHHGGHDGGGGSSGCGGGCGGGGGS